MVVRCKVILIYERYRTIDELVTLRKLMKIAKTPEGSVTRDDKSIISHTIITERLGQW